MKQLRIVPDEVFISFDVLLDSRKLNIYSRIFMILLLCSKYLANIFLHFPLKTFLDRQAEGKKTE